MQSNSSLGIYIEENFIKYAKVVKDKDSIKVEAFNVVFYENLGEALHQIINETYSFKTPICVNISNELYNYYEVFAMLNKTDIMRSVDIEFDMLCNENKYNKNSLETRFILMNIKDNPEKVKVLHIAANKGDIGKKLQLLGGSKVQSIAPISTSITNILDVSPKDNIAIINIENETKITTVVEGQISRVDTIEYGMGKILEEVNKTENSMQKSYEVCKNITIYTQETQTLQSDYDEHMESVMPILYKIATESKKIIDSSFANITKVYITGLATAINNIDLYFQEYMVNVKCEILHPFFIESASVKIPIKDYVEVNSAIALAMDGLGYGNKELNFVTSGASGAINIKKVVTDFIDQIRDPKQYIQNAFSKEFDIFEKSLMRFLIACGMIIIIYIVFSAVTMGQIKAKKNEVNKTLATSKIQLDEIDTDIRTIEAKTLLYEKALNSVNDISSSSASTKESRVIPKDGIPNLLNRIMFVIPQKVVITSIENSEDNHIVIEAQAEKYEQLGYFKALLDSKGILEDVKSTSGSKDGNLVKVKIEGDLP